MHGYDRKPKRRLFELLKAQGLQANQDVTFLTDGGEEVRALTELVTPEAEHVLDWFHIAMRLTVLEQYARGVAHHDEKEGARLLQELERTKWLLWHGNQCRAQQHADDLRDDVKALELDYPHLGKFARLAQEFAVYIRSNAGSLINYGERFRAGERISAARLRPRQAPLARRAHQRRALSAAPKRRAAGEQAPRTARRPARLHRPELASGRMPIPGCTQAGRVPSRGVGAALLGSVGCPVRPPGAAG